MRSNTNNKKSVIGVIILHFGRWKLTQECLESLEKLRSKNFILKVVVVDNSNDLLVQDKLQKFKIVTKTLITEENLGFAGGNNLGIKQCQKWDCDYYLFLNNDTIVRPDFLENLLSTPCPNPSIRGPVIEHKVKDRAYYDYGGIINWRKGQPYHVNKQSYSTKNEYISRDFVSGCCMLIPKEIVSQIGGFNQSYFLYLEDVELCLRAKQHGFSSYLIPSSKIFHKGSQSASEFTKILYSWRNSIKLTFRYVPTHNKLLALLFNAFFYPALFTQWQLKRVYQRLKP
jgi:GT2 family glycosyltransferase